MSSALHHYYTIETAKPIAVLGGISGPITSPVIMSPTVVLELVKMGYVIYEHNPYFTTEKVLVTRTNYNKIKFKTSRVSAIKKKKLNREMQYIAREDRKNTIKSEEVEKAPKKEKESKKEEKEKDSELVKPMVTDFKKN